ncbi:MAG: L-serine ammonia-lyase, iron-sulfur-dependent, subunit alpha [Clostridia bacterium]|nr:L-serine ammonia-lyase, iron-sulfur-dependent, subunit alpha [Clostridia bacterium]
MKSLKELYKIGKGPSSSHTMGPERAARSFLSLCPEAHKFRVVLYGSLAHTGKGHLTDEAVINVFAPRETEIVFDRERKDLPHPNTMEMFAYKEDGSLILQKTYLSVGGGTVCALGETLPDEGEVYPFLNFEEIRRYCVKENCGLDDVVFRFEGEDIKEYLRMIWRRMKETVECGLKKSGELPGKLHVQRKAATLSRAVAGEGVTEREKRILCSFAFATAEENASGGRIVTAPTCGASGVLPAVLMYLVKKNRISEDLIISALAVAGLIGNVVKTNASVSGAEAGCQAEIGTATAMATAAVCRVYGYTIEETEYAAEIALEHQLGLTCDPICGYVQIPCIERNAVAAMRALDGAELSHVLAGTRKISFDVIVKTMYETGKDLSERYRETSEGGLAAQYNGCR